MRIFVRITRPLSGARVVLAQVDAIGDGQSGWMVGTTATRDSGAGGDVGYTAAIRVQPMIAGHFVWQAAVTTSQGCGDATAASGPNARWFDVIDISPPAKFQTVKP